MAFLNTGDESDGVATGNRRTGLYHLYYFQQYFGYQMVASTIAGSTDIVSYASTFSSPHAGVVIINKGTSDQVVQVNFSDFTPGNRDGIIQSQSPQSI
jgi:hypothetical protein